jgi:tripartite-type tricarboxylate transporter receptor subunit TctC
MKLKTILFAALTGLTVLTHTAAFAQYPNRPIKIVVPHPPGGAVDGVARILATKLGDNLGTTVVVENRAGASGTIGAEFVAKSPADGYTLYVNASIHAINPFVLKEKPRFDAVKDFTPLSELARGPLLFSVHPGVPANTPQEFARIVRATPQKYNFATSGFGSAGHLAEEFIKARANLDIPIILYKGAGPALTDLMGGQVSAMMDPILSSGPHVRSGKLRALAITSARRSPLFPDVPTMIESGFAGFEFYSWYGLWAPANLPRDIAQRIEQATIAAVKSKEIVDRLNSQGFDAVGSSAAEFSRFIDDETSKIGRIVREANIQPQ